MKRSESSHAGPAGNARRGLPPLDRLLSHPAVASLVPLYGRDQVRVQARRVVEELRGRLAADPPPPAAEMESAVAGLPERIGAEIEALLGRPLRRVLNATGIFLHTNLGRAPLPESVARALPPLLDAYCDLEIDLATGRRGDRNRRVERLLTALTGAEAALVVNNNAAALVIALAALARDREVVVSRGELVEIGGSFRIPEIMAAAGARLVEVGATNRTRLADYEEAVGPETALLLKVFPSNFRQTGFVASVEPRQLAELARRTGVPVLVDEGSGLLRPHGAPQLAGHPSLAELIGPGLRPRLRQRRQAAGRPAGGLLVGRAAAGRALPPPSALPRPAPRPYRPRGARRGAPAASRGHAPARRPALARPGGPPRPPGAGGRGSWGPRSSPPKPSWAAARPRRRPSPARRWPCLGTTPCSPACARAIRPSSAISARTGCTWTCAPSPPRTTRP